MTSTITDISPAAMLGPAREWRDETARVLAERPDDERLRGVHERAQARVDNLRRKARLYE